MTLLPESASLRSLALHATECTTLAIFVALAGAQPAAQTRVAPLPNQASGGMTTRNLAAENFGIAGSISWRGEHWHWIDGDLTGFFVDEWFEGRDIDGDGSVYGLVWHVRDSATGRLWWFDSWGQLVEGVHVSWVRESDLGRDENGDGDMLDQLPSLFDFATEVATIVPFAYPLPPNSYPGPFDGTNGLFLVDEQNQQADLNLDGDLADRVVFRMDVKTGVVLNLGIACDRLRWDAEDDLAVFLRDEASDGNVDLNGDGDATDQVPHLYRFSTGAVTNVGVAATDVELGEGILFVQVYEADEGPGGTDLNGDGDRIDAVAHYQLLGSPTLTNLAIATTSCCLSGIPVGIVEDGLVWTTSESDQGEDLNGDGDLGDYVNYIHKVSTAKTTNLGFYADSGTAADGVLVLTVLECDNVLDLNGDGDIQDVVTWIHDVASETTTLVNAWSPRPARVAKGRVALPIYEDGRDLNNNGNASDLIVVVVDPETGLFFNTRTTPFIAVPFIPFGEEGWNYPVMHFDGDYVVFAAREADEQGEINGDLNGDADLRDIVLVAFDVRVAKMAGRKRRQTNATRLVLGALYHWYYLGLVYLSGFTLEDGVVAFENTETNRIGVGGPRTDFNGDGDKRDAVMHRIRLP